MKKVPQDMLALISSSQYPREVLQGSFERLALPRPKSEHRKMAAQICLHKDMQGYASGRAKASSALAGPSRPALS